MGSIYRQTVLLLPCHSLEDFPLHHEGALADGLLAGWTALWHPALLAETGQAPLWSRADSPPESVEQVLVVVPEVSEDLLPTGFRQRCADSGAVLMVGKTDRQELLAEALAQLPAASQVDPDLAADFLALGYCYLQVELLTRQMRYASNLDEIHFGNQAVAAARAAMAGETDECRRLLQGCFDLLSEERDHYYSVDAFLVDILLVSDHTLGDPLRQELQRSVAKNLLISGQQLEILQAEHPSSFAALREALAAGTVGLIGGDYRELPWPLMSGESLLAGLQRGLETYQRLLEHRPIAYGRHRFGLTTAIPLALTRLGYRGAVHCTFEEGRVPEGSQSKMRWEGPDGSNLEALTRVPLDASQTKTFLGLARRLGEVMDMDHVATLGLAHWPGHASPWYEDLLRVARYGHPLGRFVTMEEYFQESDYPGHLETYRSDQYRSPYLRQALLAQTPNPLSRWIAYGRRRAAWQTCASLETLADTVLPPAAASGEAEESLTWLGNAADEGVDEPLGEAACHADLDHVLQGRIQQALQRLDGVLPAGTGESGYVVWNTSSLVRRIPLLLPDLPRPPDVARPVYAAQQTPLGTAVVVDVPAMGFAWVGPGRQAPPYRPKEPLLVEDNCLRNEFFEATINPTFGTLQSMREYQKRGNRLSQQLALRTPVHGHRSRDLDPDEGGRYSIMAADSVEVTCATHVLGEIVAHGHLLDEEGRRLAEFRQTYRVWRGSRWLQLQIELHPEREPPADPWDAYYACRFAWGDEGTRIYRTVNHFRQVTEAKRLEAPTYLELEDGDQRTTIFTGGLPYHRRIGMRMLDTLLQVRGEQQDRFRFAIGLDVKHPLQESVAMLGPDLISRRESGPPPEQNTGWFFHLDQRNVTATCWEPWMEAGAVVGCRVRLLETAGRPTRCQLRSFRSLISARKMDFQDSTDAECPVQDDSCRVELAAHEWTQVELRWS